VAKQQTTSTLPKNTKEQDEQSRNGERIAIKNKIKIDIFLWEEKNNCLGSWHPSASALSAFGSTHWENLPFEQSLRTLHGYDTVNLRSLTQQYVDMFDMSN